MFREKSILIVGLGGKSTLLSIRTTLAFVVSLCKGFIAILRYAPKLGKVFSDVEPA